MSIKYDFHFPFSEENFNTAESMRSICGLKLRQNDQRRLVEKRKVEREREREIKDTCEQSVCVVVGVQST